MDGNLNFIYSEKGILKSMILINFNFLMHYWNIQLHKYKFIGKHFCLHVLKKVCLFQPPLQVQETHHPSSNIFLAKHVFSTYFSGHISQTRYLSLQNIMNLCVYSNSFDFIAFLKKCLKKREYLDKFFVAIEICLIIEILLY